MESWPCRWWKLWRCNDGRWIACLPTCDVAACAIDGFSKQKRVGRRSLLMIFLSFFQFLLIYCPHILYSSVLFNQWQFLFWVCCHLEPLFLKGVKFHWKNSGKNGFRLRLQFLLAITLAAFSISLLTSTGMISRCWGALSLRLAPRIRP